jgi:hypothetical protein
LIDTCGVPVHYRLKTDSDHLKVEEDKLKVVWHAAAIEKWLVGRRRGCGGY